MADKAYELLAELTQLLDVVNDVAVRFSASLDKLSELAEETGDEKLMRAVEYAKEEKSDA